MTLPELLDHWEFFQKKSERERMEIIRDHCRALLDDPDFVAFLTILLEDLGYYLEAKTPKDEALRNFATFMLRERFGLMEQSYQTTRALIGAKEKKE